MGMPHPSYGVYLQTMSDEERTAAANKYWVIAHGQPYLLAEEKDDSVFANEERTAQVQAAVEFVKADRSHEVL